MEIIKIVYIFYRNSAILKICFTFVYRNFNQADQLANYNETEK